MRHSVLLFILVSNSLLVRVTQHDFLYEDIIDHRSYAHSLKQLA